MNWAVQLGFGLLVAGELTLLGILITLLRRQRQLGRRLETMLHEKDVVFSFVHDVGEVFSGNEAAVLPELLRRVLFYALRTTQGGAGALYLLEPDMVCLRVHASSGVFPPLAGGIGDGYAKAMSKLRYVEDRLRAHSVRLGEGVIGEAAATGMAILVADGDLDSRVPRYDDEILHLRSVLAVPMRFRNKVLGVLAVVNPVDGLPFNATDETLLQALADQASVSVHYARFSTALAEKERLDYDLSLANRIQASLLPKAIPRLNGAELAAFSVPAERIGGDYYDFVAIDGRHLGIAIADVSGKGVAGGLVMSMCRTVLRTKAPGCLNPAQVLRAMDEVLAPDLSADMYVTMLYMVYDLQERTLRVARAGHLAPLVVPGNRGQPYLVESDGMAIGLSDRATFDALIGEKTVVLAPGDTLLAFTDGITEAMDRNRNEWGLLNLCTTVQLAAMHRADAQGLADRVRQRLLEFTGDMAQYDDMTLVALKVA